MKTSSYFPLTLASLATAQNSSIVEVLNSQGDLSTLSGLITSHPEIIETLNNASNITILAPSDDALDKFTSDNNDVMKNKDLIKALLSYHVLKDTFLSTDVETIPVIGVTLLDDPRYENVTTGQVIEGVLTDGKVTVISGKRAESKVIKADLTFDGGVIHIIDKVLTIPEDVVIAAKAAGLNSFVDALTAGDIVSTIQELSDVTIFAPNNEAFDEIAEGLKDESAEVIADVLKYHVVKGNGVGYSSAFMNGTVQTLGGDYIEIEVRDDGTLMVNGAKVVIPDVLIANGVVHVVDSVLAPEASLIADSTSSGGSGTATATSDGPNASFTGAAPRQAVAVGLVAALGGAAIVINGF